MKNILTILFVFTCLFASSQTQFLGAPNTTVVVKGNMKVDSILYLPKRTKTPTDTGALRYQISDSSLYVWTGNAWRKAKNDGTVTSVGLTMPSAFNVANSPVTSSGTIAVTAAGTTTQYIRGDGTLAAFPESSAGGAGVSYYLNGSVSQGTIGGSTYYEMNKEPVIGAGTNFTSSSDGLIAQFITDAGDPNRLQIPAGAWNFEMFFSSSSPGGTPTFYVELLKYSGTTFTSIASSSTNPRSISEGTTTTLYLTSIAVPQTTLLAADRLAVRVYVAVSGRTITFHTEDNNLAEIITTFSGGISALNGLTSNTQYFAIDTLGTDFNISSVSETHTFNIPTASATKRGLLSSANWSTFNNKVNISDTATMLGNYIRHAGFGLLKSGQALLVDTASIATRLRVQKGIDSLGAVKQNVLTNPVTGTGTTNYVSKWTGTSTQAISQIFDNGTNVGVGTASPGYKLDVNGSIRVGGTLLESNTPFLTGSNIHAATNFAIGVTSANVLSFFTSNSERIRILSGGDVGVGTSSPSYKLDITGTLRNTTGAAFATSSGSVLIGTTTDAGQKLQVNGSTFITTPTYTNTSDLGLVVASGGNVPGINLRTASTGRFSIASNYNRSNSTTFLTGTGTSNPTGEVMVIDHSTRNVQIGSDAVAAYKLDIAGDLRTTTGANFATTSGNVGVGTASPDGGFKLDVNGAIKTAGITSSVGGTFNGGVVTINNGQTGTTPQTALTARDATAAGHAYALQIGQGLVRHISTWNAVGANMAQVFITTNSTGGQPEVLRLTHDTLVGINTNAPTQRLDVNGRARVRTIDSTSTAMNILYADATGVIKKAAVPSGGGGTVTSVATGFGLSGGTITTTGTLIVDSASVATRARVQKGIDSVATIAVKGTGISGYFPKWTGTGTQDTSQLFQLGQNIGIGTATPTYRIHLPDAGNVSGQAMIAGTVLGSNGNGQTIRPSNSLAMTIFGQSDIGYIYGAAVSSTGRWGINTTSVNDATLSVDGSVKIVTVDSTATARNMLYQDANGVIKKSAVPTGLTMADDVITASGSWVATKDAGSGVTINNVAYTTNGTTKMVTADANFYIAETGWTDNTWITVGTIGSDYRPKKTINWNATFIVSGAEYERSDNTDFTGACSITGQMRVRDDGTVQINATMGSNSIAAGGTAYIIVPFQVSYIVK